MGLNEIEPCMGVGTVWSLAFSPFCWSEVSLTRFYGQDECRDLRSNSTGLRESIKVDEGIIKKVFGCVRDGF